MRCCNGGRTVLAVRRTFRAISENAGLEGLEITPHALRRIGATSLANGLGLQVAADVLGPISTSTTRDHYAEPVHTAKAEPAAITKELVPLGMR
jgi:integrase